MNTNNRNVKLQQRVVLLTVKEHSENLIIKKNNNKFYWVLNIRDTTTCFGHSPP